MKQIHEIENLSTEELMNIADDMSVEIPENLKENVRETIIAAAAAQDTQKEISGRKGTARRLIFAVSAAAACLAVFMAVRNQPKDTFDDPYLAYAELEKTFSYISSKMDKGIGIASEAGPAFAKTAEIFGGDRQ